MIPLQKRGAAQPLRLPRRSSGSVSIELTNVLIPEETFGAGARPLMQKYIFLQRGPAEKVSFSLRGCVGAEGKVVSERLQHST